MNENSRYSSIIKVSRQKLLVGWNEWCNLSKLGLPAIKAKIDTGAKTSSLHAFNIHAAIKNKKKYVYFQIHPLQNSRSFTKDCKALVIDERYITSSNGHKEFRYVISTPLTLADQTWDIELTLSNRDPLTFRMLLGREALNSRVIIDPAHTLLLGKMKKQNIVDLYGL